MKVDQRLRTFEKHTFGIGDRTTTEIRVFIVTLPKRGWKFFSLLTYEAPGKLFILKKNKKSDCSSTNATVQLPVCPTLQLDFIVPTAPQGQVDRRPQHVCVLRLFQQISKVSGQQWAGGSNICFASWASQPESEEIWGALSQGPDSVLAFLFIGNATPDSRPQPSVAAWGADLIRVSVLCFFLWGLWEQREHFIDRPSELAVVHLLESLIFSAQGWQ